MRKSLRQLQFLILAALITCGLRIAPVPEADHTIFIPFVATSTTSLSISDISDNRTDYTASEIPTYEKFEITFQVKNSVAQNFQIPYDPNPPNGLNRSNPKYNGISVDALFLPPGETDWNKAYHQPAFYYQFFDDQVKQGSDGQQRDWFYPAGAFAWKIRFSPDRAGEWQYRLTAVDASGRTQSASRSFVVSPSNNPGFIKISSTDSRYFEFDNGQPFNALGFQGTGSWDESILDKVPVYQNYEQNGINLTRIWISGIYGSAWLEWLGGRNQYDGYLPRSAIEPFHDPVNNRDLLTLQMDYEKDGDTGWFDACRFQFWDEPEAIKRNTNYRLQIRYWGQDISGPRISSYSNYGLVGKIGGGWDVNCYEPGTSNIVTNYGGNTSDWNVIEGTWNSGDNDFLPRIYLGLENVIQGQANILSISLREELGNGQFGPEILKEPSMEYDSYFPERSAYALDKTINLAEKYGVYLKLVIMEKNDTIYFKMDDDGTFVMPGESDNPDGFYGLGREVNKTRWLQEAWWRYLQARWGYSTHIHSWESANEGDPWLQTNYEMTDEMGKFMHCKVFGVTVSAGDGQKCTLDHPDSHLVTTSFWHSFPAEQFWMNANYPNVDYADVHAYISTSQVGVPADELDQMQWDAALYHLGHSRVLSGWHIGKPIVRGEAGIDYVGQQVEQPDLTLDQNGVWLHNYLWSTLDPGALTELYWWDENRENEPGPDGQPGLYEVYKYFSDFIHNIPLNNGNYVDVRATLSDPDLRVVGQKDPVNNRADLWVQNMKHTWKNVVDGLTDISGLSGNVTVDGFNPNTTLSVELHEFTDQGLPSIVKSSVQTDGNGTVVIPLPSDQQITDVGIKIGE